VFRAVHNKTQAMVALKVVDMEDEDLNELIREVEIMKGLEARYIVQYFGSYIRDDRLWIAMEYAGVGSVADIMKVRKQGMEEAHIANLLQQVLMGLDYLHEQRLIHRDLKSVFVFAFVFGFLTFFRRVCVVLFARSFVAHIWRFSAATCCSTTTEMQS
jgi:serine/threonine-protein kinase 24/25/MST4